MLFWVTAIAGLLLCTAFPARAASPQDKSRYDVSGTVLHQCSCHYACPCMFENGPSDCALAAVYHFDQGTWDGVDVSGLSLISVDGSVEAHHNSMTGGACCADKTAPASSSAPEGVIYVDMHASPVQRRALLGLLEAHGEWPGPGRPVKSVVIAFSKTPVGYHVLVPGLFHGETALVRSRKGTPMTVDGVGFPEGSHWTVGRSIINDLHDSDLHLHWHLPDTNGSWSQFHWQTTSVLTENAPVAR